MRNGVSPRPNINPPGTRILRISANRSGYVNLNDFRYMPNGEEKFSKYLLKNRDLLFTRYNGNIDLVGVCGQVNNITDSYLYPDKLIRVRVDNKHCLQSFIEYTFQTKAIRNYITSKSKSSAGQNGLSGKDLKATIIPLPPLEEQKEIVRQVDALFALAYKLETQYQNAKEKVGKLSQSVLAKAFRGELVITEAELAEKEGRGFETAEKLLKRIKAEKAKMELELKNSKKKVSKKKVTKTKR